MRWARWRGSSPMDDLIGWLRSQLDRDEELARAAMPGPWEHDGTDDEVYSAHNGEHGDQFGNVVAYARGGERESPNAWHIANWNPARALREVEAKRRLLGLHTPI